MTSDKCSAQYQEAKIRTVMLKAGLCLYPSQALIEIGMLSLGNFFVYQVITSSCALPTSVNIHTKPLLRSSNHSPNMLTNEQTARLLHVATPMPIVMSSLSSFFVYLFFLPFECGGDIYSFCSSSSIQYRFPNFPSYPVFIFAHL